MIVLGGVACAAGVQAVESGSVELTPSQLDGVVASAGAAMSASALIAAHTGGANIRTYTINLSLSGNINSVDGSAMMSFGLSDIPIFSEQY